MNAVKDVSEQHDVAALIPPKLLRALNSFPGAGQPETFNYGPHILPNRPCRPAFDRETADRVRTEVRQIFDTYLGPIIDSV